MPTDDFIIATTRAWIEQAVIGLNLCPFAKAVYVKEQIRYVVSPAQDTEQLRADLACELRALHASDPQKIDTTLLIHPQVLTDFLDYNDFLAEADAEVDAAGLSGEIQIASFHPEYRFADSSDDDIENFTNRSPYPILHLLRESSIDRAVAAFPEADMIYEKNMETLRRLGRDGWEKLKLSPDAI
jgi:uncharacterized protein